jgi:hypothetical protein
MVIVGKFQSFFHYFINIVILSNFDILVIKAHVLNSSVKPRFLWAYPI